MIYKLADKQPQFDDSNFIAASADVIGDVVLEENASIWFGCVLRGDMDTLTVGADSNIQDSAVLHTDAGIKLTIGRNVTVGHKAMIHGCTVGDNALIGINAVILNNAVIGENSLIGANSLVPEGKVIPPRSLVVGSPCKVLRELTDQEVEALKKSAQHYVANAQEFMAKLEPI